MGAVAELTRRNDELVLLVSAHSLPLRAITEDDPHVERVWHPAEGVAAALGERRSFAAAGSRLSGVDIPVRLTTGAGAALQVLEHLGR